MKSTKYYGNSVAIGAAMTVLVSTALVQHYALFVLPLLAFPLLAFLYLRLTPRPTYLLDFACYRPPDHLKISKADFIDLAQKSGDFTPESIEFQRQVLEGSGIGDESYMPRKVFIPGHKMSLTDGREEAAAAMFGAVEAVLAATRVRPKDIGILVVNCGVLNTTPSLASMLINHFKLRSDVQSFNLGGMGCSAGIVAVEVAADLLGVYSSSYALVVSTEAVTFTWYKGQDHDKLIPNCFMRMGAAAIVLSGSRAHRWRAKYQLSRLHRTHLGSRIIRVAEDAERKQGVSVDPKVVEAMLSAVSWHRSVANPEFEHACVGAVGKKVLDDVQTEMGFSDEMMRVSKKTLERFGNTSSSSVWYQLAYLESAAMIKTGDRVWQMAVGSGIKCNSLVLKALRDVANAHTPWD